VDGRGYIRIRPTLQVDAHPDIFAVGDCASLRGERLPRAGVYAVRQGPVLRENLEAWLAGERPRAWEPQGDFLALLNLGDGRAMAVKWGWAVVGRWVMWLKDRIDRRFVERFQR
jgi:selenide,water dikinase